MIFCDQCRTENRAHARFCLHCGAALETRPDESDILQDGWPPEERMVDNEAEAEAEAVIDETRPNAAVHRDAPSTREEPGDEPGDEMRIDKPADPSDAPIALLGPPPDSWEAEPAHPGSATEALQEAIPVEPTDVSESQGENRSMDNNQDESIKTQPSVLRPSTTLPEGARLAERYEIVGLLQETEHTIVYDALDYGQCSQCGYADSQAGDVYCANCGASLEDERDVPHVRLCALHLEGEAVIQLEDETEGQVESWFEWDGRLYATLPPPVREPAEAPAPPSGTLRHLVGSSSHPGLQRELDEDAILVLTVRPTFEGRSAPSLGLYAVADGMGGHEGGEVASRLAIEELAQTITKRLLLPELTGEPVLPETPADLMRETVQAINTRLFELQETTGSDLGTTLTAALVRDRIALIANVGDSRTYLWRDGELHQLTTDHSLVAQLVEAGALAPDEIYTHPDKSAIYRSLGHTPEVEVDLFTQELEPGDRLLLCCDGAWEMLRPDGIEEVLLMEADPQRACEEIIRRANWAGGEDNISSVIVQLEIVANA